MKTNKYSNVQLQLFVVIFGIILLVAKFTAYVLTHSNAILSDALESIVNVAAAFMGLYSLRLSAKPRDEDHPYGHGKIEFVSAAVEGSLILFAGVLVIGKSGFNFFHPQHLESLDVGLYIIVATGAVNYLIGFFAERQGHKTGSLALVSSGQHLKSDAYTTGGIIIGLILILIFKTGWLDNAVAILFGAWITFIGVRVARKALAGIMDEADYELLEKLISKLNANRQSPWVDLHNMRVSKYGTVWHIDCHLTVPWYFTVREAHKQIELLYDLVNKEFQNPVEFSIHTDYCLPPQQCKICILDSCNERKAMFERRVEWNLETVLKNEKHGL
ncbi:MAG: cation diffusion facilitator family transporter [Chitinophagales bacterium]